MGGSHVALPDADASMFLINPAYINENLHRNFSVGYLNHVGDVNMGFAGGVWQFNGIGTFGAGIRYMNYGELKRTDASGVQDGTFSANDLAFTAGLSRELMPDLYGAVALTFVHSSIDVYSSTGIAVNAGIVYHLSGPGLDLGASISNAGTQLSSFDGRKEKLPLDIRAGVSRRLENLPLRISITAHSLDRWNLETFNDEDEPGFTSNLFRHVIIGGEFYLSSNVQLRVGYDHFLHEELKSKNRLDTAGFSFGLGIRYRGFVFDFSRNSYSEIGGITRIGIQTNI